MLNSNTDINKLHFIEKGKGRETLLFIHGMGCNARIWSNMIDKLSNTYRCISIDLPEHGESPSTAKPFTLTTLVDAVHHFIIRNELDKQNLHLIGHSMGAQISIILGIRFPALFTSLVLIAPAGVESYSKNERMMIEASVKMLPFFSSEEQMKSMLKLSWFNNNTSKLNNYLSALSKSKNFSFENYFKSIQHSILAMLNEPVDMFLKSITVPTLIIFGEEDKMIPNPVTKRTKTVEIAKNAHKLIPNSNLLMIPNKGHFLPFEADNECVKAILDFLKL